MSLCAYVIFWCTVYYCYFLLRSSSTAALAVLRNSIEIIDRLVVFFFFFRMVTLDNKKQFKHILILIEKIHKNIHNKYL